MVFLMLVWSVWLIFFVIWHVKKKPLEKIFLRKKNDSEIIDSH